VTELVVECRAISNQGREAKNDGSSIPAVSDDDSTSVDFLGAEQDKQLHQEDASSHGRGSRHIQAEAIHLGTGF
jgi:hypothetical protein